MANWLLKRKPEEDERALRLEDPPPDTSPHAPDLGPWLQQLLDASGMSKRAVAQAIGYDRSALTRWFTSGTGMSASTLLKFLSAVGARVIASDGREPQGGPKAVNAELAHLRAVTQQVANRLPPTAIDEAEAAVRRLDAGGVVPAEDLERLADAMRRVSAATTRLADRLQADARAEPQ